MAKLFGGLIAVVLLGIYLHLIRAAILFARCTAKVACSPYAPPEFNPEMTQALAVVGGLVSALVIAQLAVTKPGGVPLVSDMKEGAPDNLVRLAKLISVFYVLSWVGAGFWAFMTGMYHPKALPVLTTMGQAWLGLAVSAAYAYFGLHPAASHRAEDSADETS